MQGTSSTIQQFDSSELGYTSAMAGSASFSDGSSAGDSKASHFFRFGVFEVDPRGEEIRREGLRIKLPGKSFQLLLILLENAGNVVLRDELRAGLWPADTFVDFDANIKTTLNRLRQSLGDPAENPVFVETIPRVGVRFIAPVTRVERKEISISHPIGPATNPQSHPNSPGDSVLAYRWSPFWRTAVVVSLILAMAVLGLVVRRLRPFEARASSARVAILLVLPFDNLSGDPSQQYFSDGMTDEMITAIGQQAPHELSVIGRSSAMRYRGTEKPISQIAHELGGADYVLEGSVRRSSNHVAINAQLVRTRDQAVLWAQTYQREVADLLEVQQDVAQQVSHSILQRLVSSPQVSAARSIDAHAHDSYLMGLYYQQNKRTGLDLLKSLEYFQTAIREDPNYAEAYAALAHSYMIAAGWEMMKPSEAYPKAKTAAERAVQLDPNLASAHMALAAAEQEYYWKWATAETEFRRAIELDPNASMPHKGYAEFLMDAGRNGEAIVEVERAVSLDPYALGVRLLSALVYLFAGKYERATQACNAIIQVDPKFAPAYYVLGSVYEVQGQYANATAQFQLAERLSDGSPKMLAALAEAYALSGHRQDAERVLSTIEETAKSKYVSPFSLATVYAGLGDKRRALDFLEKAVTEHSSDLMYLGHSPCPCFKGLRDDPRFLKIIKEVGFPSVGAENSGVLTEILAPKPYWRVLSSRL
jgi:TolB-like protein/DNA-binding winged helix-turn-helix (wHTH) protein/tetratricopeptide (TPR) repeat protein